LIQAYLALVFLFGCIYASKGVLYEHDAQFYMNLIALTLTIFYPLAIKYLEKENLIDRLDNWKRKEIVYLSILIGLILFLNTGEVADESKIAFYIFLFSLLLLFTYNWIYFFRIIDNKPVLDILFFKYHAELLFNIFLSFALILMMIRFKEDPNHQYLFYISEVLFVALLLYFLLTWLIEQWKSIRQLKNEKSKSELQQLKSQVNPHFFFNTLNNLYGLIKDDSEKARELVLQLSEMMRYSIYEGQKDQVPLSREIEYIKTYIDLHKSRYHKTITVIFNCNIDNDNYKIMPLLFIILVENAFKHGVEKLRKSAYIKIDLHVKNSELLFSVENDYNSKSNLNKRGIGINNLEKRLALVYQNKHNLNHFKDDNIYTSELKLSLK